jgi:hypothetical protein
MARSDDLAPLLAASPGPAVGYRQGVIVTWDPDTAENTVTVGATLLENLNVLNTSEAAILAPGDVVGILTLPGTWAILGRLTIPGTPEAVTSIQAITNRIQVAQDPAGGKRNSTSWGDLTGAEVGPSVEIRVGSSGRVLAFWSCEFGQTTATAGGALQSQRKNTPHVGVALTGANTADPNEWEALNAHLDFATTTGDDAAVLQFWLQAGTMHLYTGLTPGLTTFTMKYRHDGLTPGADSNFSARELALFAL